MLNETCAEDAARLSEAVTGMQVISSPFNLGLAGAGNRGRDLARGAFFLLLHDDAEVEPGFDRHRGPRAGVCGLQSGWPAFGRGRDGRVSAALGYCLGQAYRLL